MYIVNARKGVPLVSLYPSGPVLLFPLSFLHEENMLHSTLCLLGLEDFLLFLLAQLQHLLLSVGVVLQRSRTFDAGIRQTSKLICFWFLF